MSLPSNIHHEVELAVGIDLGTYNSAAATAVGNRPVMLRAREGATDQGTCFPSVVEFDEEGQMFQVGELARRSMPVYPERVVCGVKRLIGKAFDRASEAGDTNRFGYQTCRGPDGSCQIHVGRQVYSPTDITTLILRKIKRDAEADFNPIGREIQEAVITVPAYFDPFQKSETERAALAAGF
jgi:molecular chaperone DnaK